MLEVTIVFPSKLVQISVVHYSEFRIDFSSRGSGKHSASHPFTTAAPRTSSTFIPALPHCSQDFPRAPFAQSCPEQPNIYAFTYVLVLYIRCPPAEKGPEMDLVES